MNDSRSTSLRHRVHFRRAAAGLALGLITTLTGCSGGGTAPNGTLVMIIRHGEKPGEKKTGDMPGLDASGHKNHNALTQTGWDRAQALVNVFAPDSGKPRAGLARPKAIYAAGADSKGDGLRTRETVSPLADKLGLHINTDFGKGDEAKLVAKVSSEPGPTLICWQHGEIPKLAKAFGHVTPKPPHKWSKSQYDVIWTLTKTSGGWAFAQMPEMALPQDDQSVIKN